MFSEEFLSSHRMFCEVFLGGHLKSCDVLLGGHLESGNILFGGHVALKPSNVFFGGHVLGWWYGAGCGLCRVRGSPGFDQRIVDFGHDQTHHCISGCAARADTARSRTEHQETAPMSSMAM